MIIHLMAFPALMSSGPKGPGVPYPPVPRPIPPAPYPPR